MIVVKNFRPLESVVKEKAVSNSVLYNKKVKSKDDFTNKLNSCRIAINVDHDPEGSTSIEAAKEDALVVPVYVEHHITTSREVEREENVDIDVALG